MIDFPGKPVVVCCAALVFSLVANASSLADPRSVRPTPPGQDSSSGATNNTTPSDPQAGAQSSNGGNSGSTSRAGGDGELLTDIPLKDAWSLQFGVTVDPEQQSRPNGAGDINGRVGLGFRF